MASVSGSWFRVELFVLAREDEAAPEICALVKRALEERPVEGLVVAFGAPSDEVDGG